MNKESRAVQKNTGNIMAGIVLLTAGALLLSAQVGADLPRWFYGWEMLLIGIGLFIGAKNMFTGYGWLIIAGVGAVFLVDRVAPNIFNYVWPAAIIAVGLFMILRPGRKKSYAPASINHARVHKDAILDMAAVFGGANKIVLSKDFKGGEVVAVFGGAEIDLSKADFKDTIMIEIVAVFAGVKLIVPPNWEIRSETAAIFGGVEDTRKNTGIETPAKVIVLEGIAVFGGIEIASI